MSKPTSSSPFTKYYFWISGGVVVTFWLYSYIAPPTTVVMSPWLLPATPFIGLLTAGWLAVTAKGTYDSFASRSAPSLSTSADSKALDIVAASANNCVELAAYHERKSRSFLTVGLVAAGLGLVFYIGFLVSLSIDDRTSSARPRASWLGFETIDLSTDLAVERNRIAKNGQPYDLEKIDRLLERAEKVQKALGEESAQETRLAVEARQFSFRADLLPVIRNSIAFLFIEVMAGFFLSLAQRNDFQASYWRSHRQLYERLLAAPGIIEALKASAGEANVNADLIKLIITPVPAPIFTGKNDVNPSLEAVAAAGDLIQRLKDASKA